MKRADMKLSKRFKEVDREVVTWPIISAIVFLAINIVSGLAFWIYCIPNFSKILEISSGEILINLATLVISFLLFISLRFVREISGKKRRFTTKVIKILDFIVTFYSFYKVIELGILSREALMLIEQNTTFLTVTGLIYCVSIFLFVPPYTATLHERGII